MKKIIQSLALLSLLSAPVLAMEGVGEGCSGNKAGSKAATLKAMELYGELKQTQQAAQRAYEESKRFHLAELREQNRTKHLFAEIAYFSNSKMAAENKKIKQEFDELQPQWTQGLEKGVSSELTKEEKDSLKQVARRLKEFYVTLKQAQEKKSKWDKCCEEKALELTQIYEALGKSVKSTKDAISKTEKLVEKIAKLEKQYKAISAKAEEETPEFRARMASHVQMQRVAAEVLSTVFDPVDESSAKAADTIDLDEYERRHPNGFVGAFIPDEENFNLVLQDNGLELLEAFKGASKEELKEYPSDAAKIFEFGGHVFVFSKDGSED